METIINRKDYRREPKLNEGEMISRLDGKEIAIEKRYIP